MIKLFLKAFGDMAKKLRASKRHRLVNIKVNLNKVKDKGKVNFFGIMESIILDNGKKVKKMEVVIGNPKKVKATLDNGSMEK